MKMSKKGNMRITYSECLFVSFRFLHVMCMRHIVICVPSGCTIIIHNIPRKA